MGSCTSTTSTAPAKPSDSVVTCDLVLEGNAVPTPDEKLVEASCHNMNCVNPKTKLGEYYTVDAIFNFRDSEAEMTCMDFAESTLQAKESFPDLAFRWDSVEEVSPGRVIIKNFRGNGTHTGQPYAFGPYPAIAPTGKTFEDPPQEMTCTIHDGKISHVLIDSFGKPSGPPGVYEQIGGILI